MQKTITIDLFSHKSIPNDGRVDQFYLQDHHEAIIPRRMWVEVQDILNGKDVGEPPTIEDVADLTVTDVPEMLDDFVVIRLRKDETLEYLR